MGVIGGLALWNVNLDIVSMITIVMSIGFSVDFVAHVTYHYLIARGNERRLNKALRVVGYPIVQAAASTIIGVMTLAPVDSYMVRTFVKTVVLVVGLGMLHGLLFLPVFLSLLVPAASYLDSLHTYQALGNYLSTKVKVEDCDIISSLMLCSSLAHLATAATRACKRTRDAVVTIRRRHQSTWSRRIEQSLADYMHG